MRSPIPYNAGPVHDPEANGFCKRVGTDCSKHTLTTTSKQMRAGGSLRQNSVVSSNGHVSLPHYTRPTISLPCILDHRDYSPKRRSYGVPVPRHGHASGKG